MSRLHAKTVVVSVAATVLLAVASGAGAQDTLSAKLDASGMVQVATGDVELLIIELNAHGPNWQHAPQASATAEVGDLPDGAGKQFVVTLPIPNTDGGALRFTESVTTLPQGFRLEYDIGVTQAIKLNGLQLSICLPVTRYAGKEVVVSQPDDDPQIVGLPQEPKAQAFQLWSGQGAKIDAGKDTGEEVTVELRAATDVVIQDLRQWERPTFEVRFPAIMEDAGREVAADDKFHLDLTFTFPAPVTLEGP